MLYITSPKLIFLITESLYVLTPFTHFPLCLAPSNHQSVLCFCEFSFVRFPM